jgi:hypothetical protein
LLERQRFFEFRPEALELELTLKPEQELKYELELAAEEAGLPDGRRAFAPVERSPDAIANRSPVRQRR